jgi:hypothetical protein
VFGTDGSCHKLSPRCESAGKPVGKISITADGGSATIESLVIYEMISIWK